MGTTLKTPLPGAEQEDSIRTLEEALGPELSEAAYCYARLISWGCRAHYSTWRTNRAKVVLMCTGLLTKFVVLMLRNVPVKKQTKNGEQPRRIFHCCYWHKLTVHLISTLELVRSSVAWRVLDA